jgi:fatty-acyl-CoA synthase
MSIIDRVVSELAYLRGAIRALRRTKPIARNPDRTIRDLFESLAQRFGDRPALFSDRELLTFQELNGRANRYARWARANGLGKGQVVSLLMPNRPEFVAVWLGIAKSGGITALLNTNLPGQSLAHCINSVDSKILIVDAALLPLLETANGLLRADIKIFVHGETSRDLPRVDLQLLDQPADNLTGDERTGLTINDRCLYIFTSGTTGMPKAANVNHYRVQLAILGYSGVTGARADDRMYVTLPMYHTVGGVCATGAVLSVGGSCYIREKFSAREFWTDVIEHDCTMFAYIGEMCRYLLATPPSPADRAHRIRLCFGNGLRPDIFEAFRDRFGLAHIIEFYAATEGNVTLFNFDSKPGAVGRLPKWMERSFVVKVVRFDIETEQPVRDAAGRCIECAPDEIGEAIGQIIEDPNKPAARFEGYADKASSERKILRDVFTEGDKWFRSGDLMRKDALGYFYFIDRIGDTFRWKSENVSTTEVAEAISTYPGIHEVNVYGVKVKHSEGRAGMAALVVDDVGQFDFDAFRQHLTKCLPEYARPLFLRFQDHLEMTSTFKARKLELVDEAFDPVRVRDPLFFNDARRGAFVPVDEILYQELQDNRVRI